MSMEPISFLEAVAGFAQQDNASSASRPMRLATIDPAYVPSSFPGTLPKVTFDGESTLSGKRYPVMSGYLPRPSDRVVLAPVGTTYLILGSVDNDTVGYHGDGAVQGDAWMWEDFDVTNDTFTNTSYAAVSTMGTAFVAGQSGAVLIHFAAQAGHNGTTISQSTYMTIEVRTGSTVGSGTVVLTASDTNAARVFNQSIDAGFKYGSPTRIIPVTGLTPGSTYNVRPMHKTQVGTAAYINRHVLVMQTPGPLG